MKKTSFLFTILFSFFVQHCALTEGLGIPTYGSYTGKEAKEKIGDAILEAEATASAFWLSQRGMRGGLAPITPLLAINGLLAQALFPLVSTIQDNANYKSESVDDCASRIRTQGAIALGSTYETLAPGGLTGVVRDASLLPGLANCQLEETSNIIQLPKGLEL